MVIEEPDIKVTIGIAAGGAIAWVVGLAYFIEDPMSLLAALVVAVVVLPISAAVALAGGYLVALRYGSSVEEPGYCYLKFLAASAVSLASSALLPYGEVAGAVIFIGMLMWLFQYQWWEALIMAIAIRAVTNIIVGGLLLLIVALK